MIVHTPALIAILRREPEADRFTDALLAASEPKMSGATLVEARIVAQRDNGAAELEALIEAAGIEIVPADLVQIDLAFAGFLRFGKGRRLRTDGCAVGVIAHRFTPHALLAFDSHDTLSYLS